MPLTSLLFFLSPSSIATLSFLSITSFSFYQHHQPHHPNLPIPQPLHNLPQFLQHQGLLIPIPSPLLTQDDLKKLAASKAIKYVSTDMVLALGIGSIAAFVVAKLSELLKTSQLKDLVGVPTSNRTQEQVATLGIPLSILDDHPGWLCRLRWFNSVGITILVRLQELFKDEGVDAKLRLDGDGKPCVRDNTKDFVNLCHRHILRRY